MATQEETLASAPGMAPDLDIIAGLTDKLLKSCSEDVVADLDLKVADAARNAFKIVL